LDYGTKKNGAQYFFRVDMSTETVHCEDIETGDRQMFTAYNQKTMEIIATGAKRNELHAIAEATCGRFGYIIREEVKQEPLPANWCSTDGEWWN
jgi:hypothetical protein